MHKGFIERLLTYMYAYRERRRTIGLYRCPHDGCTFVAVHPVGIAEHSILQHHGRRRSDCLACAAFDAADVPAHEACVFDGCSYVACSPRPATVQQSFQRHVKSASTHIVHYALCGTCAACVDAKPTLAATLAEVAATKTPKNRLPGFHNLRHVLVRIAWPSIAAARAAHPDWGFASHDCTDLVTMFAVYGRRDMTYQQLVEQTCDVVRARRAEDDVYLYHCRNPTKRSGRAPCPVRSNMRTRKRRRVDSDSASTERLAKRPLPLECAEALSSSTRSKPITSVKPPSIALLCDEVLSVSSDVALSSEATAPCAAPTPERSPMPWESAVDWTGTRLESLVPPLDDVVDDEYLFI